MSRSAAMRAVKASAAGGGIGTSASFIAAPYVERGLLVPVPDESSTITAVWPESRRASPNVKAFVAFLEEVFPKRAPWDAAIAAAGLRQGRSVSGGGRAGKGARKA